MRKIIGVVLAVTLILGLTACGKKQEAVYQATNAGFEGDLSIK